MSLAKFGFISFLQGSAGVSALVSDRVYPRRLDKGPTLPALVVEKVGERILTEVHSMTNSGGVWQTDLRVWVFAKTDYDAEVIRKAVIDAAVGYTGAMGSITARGTFLNEDADFSDDDLVEMDLFAGNVDFSILWNG